MKCSRLDCRGVIDFCASLRCLPATGEPVEHCACEVSTYWRNGRFTRACDDCVVRSEIGERVTFRWLP